MIQGGWGGSLASGPFDLCGDTPCYLGFKSDDDPTPPRSPVPGHPGYPAAADGSGPASIRLCRIIRLRCRIATPRTRSSCVATRASLPGPPHPMTVVMT